jgi:hypothetical protein
LAAAATAPFLLGGRLQRIGKGADGNGRINCQLSTVNGETMSEAGCSEQFLYVVAIYLRLEGVMIVQKRIAWWIISLLIILTGLAACQSGDENGYVGRYVNVANDKQFLDLYDDDTRA